MSSQLGPGKINTGLLRWADRMPEVELWCPSVADTVCQLEWRFFLYSATLCAPGPTQLFRIVNVPQRHRVV